MVSTDIPDTLHKNFPGKGKSHMDFYVQYFLTSFPGQKIPNNGCMLFIKT
jgi:hypothetical protein